MVLIIGAATIINNSNGNSNCSSNSTPACWFMICRSIVDHVQRRQSYCLAPRLAKKAHIQYPVDPRMYLRRNHRVIPTYYTGMRLEFHAFRAFWFYKHWCLRMCVSKLVNLMVQSWAGWNCSLFRQGFDKYHQPLENCWSFGDPVCHDRALWPQERQPFKVH